MKADGTVLANQQTVTGLTITAGSGAFTFDDQSYTINVNQRLEIRGQYDITTAMERSRRTSCCLWRNLLK